MSIYIYTYIVDTHTHGCGEVTVRIDRGTSLADLKAGRSSTGLKGQPQQHPDNNNNKGNKSNSSAPQTKWRTDAGTSCLDLRACKIE